MVRRAVRTAALLAALAAPPALAGQGASLVGPGGSVDWNRFYTAAETNQILAELHALYPGLTELYAVGTSRAGQPLMMMEITNESTGPASEKPALYVDGGIHAGEFTGSSVATHFIGHLLQGYGKDPRVTALLDRRAFYVRPKFNPDGSDLALLHDQFLRSTPTPMDEDEDGVADEDPPQDLDGDGWITQMRVPDPDGAWVLDPADARILIRDPRREQPGARFDVVREGVDDDGDGALNEDGFGGIDMNRNFPRNWEREHLQEGAGDFPLSEPETRAAVEFINAHRNITGIIHGHTSGGFVYRLPSAEAPSTFPAIDLQLIVHLGEEYTRTTGRPVRPSSTHPTEHRYGTLLSWAYWDQGMIGWVPEFVPGPEEWVTDYDGNGEISEAESHRFNDEKLGGRYFSPWKAHDHPQLGRVEIGGWHTKFWGQNPPPEFLEAETSKQMPWYLYIAEQSPLLEVTEPRLTAQGDGTFQVEVTLSNAGYLPTTLTDRGAVGEAREEGGVRAPVVRPPWALLEVQGAEITDGTPRRAVGHLAGSNPYLQAVTERSRTVSWIVRPTGPGASVRVVAGSDKGGVRRTGEVPVR
ncbi:MAG TPA: M14 family metallopeptidase [Longimicrobiales bacterium]|nr:M14 family metallopeptidase [Longimicrobiales bacterium]